jgi:hypothetical protein
MPDWNTRLEVTIGGKTIAPISQFTPTFNSQHTVVHSIEADNLGYVKQPTSYTFNMTVSAISESVADLTALAVGGQEFEVSLAERKGTDWSFKSIKLHRCIILSANPSNVVIDGAPAASFNCAALTANLE